MERTILHCDMNNCYASIETMLHPEWKGRPLAVCGSQEDRHGIVLAKSQEAKILGIKTGEVIWQAKQKCPDLLIVPPHYEEYLKYSKLARKIYYDYTNQVEPFGIDECWLDVSGSVHLFGKGETIAYEIKERIKKELGITVSIGVSFNKIFAKLGSDMKKPDAVTVIPRERFKEILWPLKASEMLGVGPATMRKLERYGITTLGQLAKINPKFLKMLFGVNGLALWRYVHGLDDSRVMDAHYKAPIKSIGHGITCKEDLVNDSEVFRVFLELSQDVSARLRDSELEATGVQITVRNEQLSFYQYQKQLRFPTQRSGKLAETAISLFKSRYPWEAHIRSLTIRAINLVKEGTPYQVDLFHDYEKEKKGDCLDKSIYELRKRFGKNCITFASLIGDIKMPKDRTEVVTLPGAMYV